METVIRKGHMLGGVNLKSINKAKRASRLLSGKVVVHQHSTKRHFPVANGFHGYIRKPSSIIHTGEAFWKKMSENHITAKALTENWPFARKMSTIYIHGKSGA